MRIRPRQVLPYDPFPGLEHELATGFKDALPDEVDELPDENRSEDEEAAASSDGGSGSSSSETVVEGESLHTYSGALALDF